MAAVYEFPVVPDDASRPFAFGDILEIDPAESCVVALPELSGGQLLGLELDSKWRIVRDEDGLPETLVCAWDSAERRVGHHSDLADTTQQLLEPYRRGVLLNDSHWDHGIEFVEAEESETLRRGRLDELSPGTRSLVEQIFGAVEAEAPETCHRVLWHTEDDWSTWRWRGPVPEAEVEKLLVDVFRNHSPPQAIRRGVYRSGPDNVNKLEIWRHTSKVAEQRLIRGQGESDPK